MKKYAILCNPGHNRIYFETSLILAKSEFLVASQKMEDKPTAINHEIISNINYFTFEINEDLTVNDLKIVSNLSFVFALFKVVKVEEKDCFVPISRNNKFYVDESISSILKYSGKTNELFTRMMINVAMLSQDETENIKLFDPIAGKGTTLYEGLIKGFDVYGMEVGEKVTAEAFQFLKKFCQNNKYKHSSDVIRVSGPNKEFTGIKHNVQIAPTKEDAKNKAYKTAEIIAGNSINADYFYKKNFFNLIVGDLPYGIQHGNVTGEKQSSLTRNPTQLLRACLPKWGTVLKSGGVVCLAWNANVLTREKVIGIFEEKGFEVLNNGAYKEFAHKVDQSILRDIIVAKKT
ncbi:MAG: hypothetical protein R3Y35_06370 [Clostridia bacterium]